MLGLLLPLLLVAQAPNQVPATQPVGHAKLALASGSKIAIIPIKGEITYFTEQSLKRRSQRAIKDGATLLVLKIHTNGGQALAGLAMARMLRQMKVPTVAWVDGKAYSAGSLIASACDQIVMTPSSVIGDTAPIVPGRNLAPTERAKALSPILTAFRNNATTNGYPYVLFHAMAQLGIVVHMIQNPATGKRLLVNQADFDIMVKGESPSVVASRTDAKKVGAVTPQVATAADRGKWVAVTTLPSGRTIPNGVVHAGNTLLTLTQTEASDVGLCSAVIANQTQLKKHFQAAVVGTYPVTWSAHVADFLSNTIVRAVLLVIFLVGAYMELSAPGISVPGILAAISLILLLGAPYLVGLADIWEIVIFFIGALLLIIELFFTPSFGILGVIGLLMMFFGLVMSAVPTAGGPAFGPIGLPAPAMYSRLVASLISMIVGLIVSFAGFYAVSFYFGKIPVLNRLVLAATGSSATSGMPTPPVSGDEAVGEGGLRVGDVGRVTSQLRPSGRAEFRGHTVDVVSLGSWLLPGTTVKIIDIQGNRIVVDHADQPTNP